MATEFALSCCAFILFITKEVCFRYRQSQRLLDDANETHCQWIMLLVWKRLNINQRHYTYVYIVPNISISIGLKAQTQYSFSILIPLKKQVQTEWNQFQRSASIFFIYKLKAGTACPVKSTNIYNLKPTKVKVISQTAFCLNKFLLFASILSISAIVWRQLAIVSGSRLEALELLSWTCGCWLHENT